MQRREFLCTATASGAVATTAGSAVAQESTPEDSGGTTEVVVGPGGELVFDPETVYITPGTTVRWVWESDNHNVVPESIPEDAAWEGQPPDETFDTGHEYSHTFETLGTYDYFCQPHKSVGMVGSVVVNESGEPPGGGEGGSGEQGVHEMGVPIQAQYVGIATVLAMVVSLLFTFFVLKHGESPHSSGAT